MFKYNVCFELSLVFFDFFLKINVYLIDEEIFIFNSIIDFE
ncbi:hypothetical protein SAMN05444275_101349 [Myroides odoratimimus subsp. xuanwuensis]|nr:hypothetical protein SAMN05444275_101349 [Myroides odoratimimus subsp. xuanwuensis]